MFSRIKGHAYLVSRLFPAFVASKQLHCFLCLENKDVISISPPAPRPPPGGCMSTRTSWGGTDAAVLFHVCSQEVLSWLSFVWAQWPPPPHQLITFYHRPSFSGYCHHKTGHKWHPVGGLCGLWFPNSKYKTTFSEIKQIKSNKLWELRTHLPTLKQLLALANLLLNVESCSWTGN